MKIWLPSAGDGCVADLWQCTEHGFIDPCIVRLTGSQAAVVSEAFWRTELKKKELLNINPLICFQGAGSWRGQWTERLHVDLRHRLPPSGSLLLFFFVLSLSASLLSGRVGVAGLEDTAWQAIGQCRIEKVTSQVWIRCDYTFCKGIQHWFWHLKNPCFVASVSRFFDPSMIFIEISLVLES